MNNECTIIYIGYALLFVLLLIMTKLYNNLQKKAFNLEIQNIDLLIAMELLKMERGNKE